MKAIETAYDGYRFRSRLEARWAVFFNTLGISYEYEKEGFDLDGTYYLPDFWLPEQKCWIEVKGQEPTKKEIEKCQHLSKALAPIKPAMDECTEVYILAGQIPLHAVDSLN